MFNERHYVPILYGKRGEFSALRELGDVTRASITPMMIVPQVPWDYINDVPAKTLDLHLEGFIDGLSKAWGRDSPFFIDMRQFSQLDVFSDGQQAVARSLELVWAQFPQCIPVLSYPDWSDSEASIASSAAAASNGLCVRLCISRLDEDDDLGALLLNISERYNIMLERIDVVLDMEDILEQNAGLYRRLASSMINGIPELATSRTLTLAGTSFPQTLSGVEGGTIEVIARNEWNIWSGLLRSQRLGRLPAFGDYAISATEVNDIDPRQMTMTASIRYTHEDSFIVVKGRSVKRHSFDQFHERSEALVGSAFFYGVDHCGADRQIAACAQRATSTGNASTWRKLGTLHHLTLVSEMVANFS